MSQKQWRTIQKELESVGITAAQFTANRDKVLSILRDAFREDVEEGSAIEIKKVGQLSRILSALSNRSGQLLAAAESGNIKEARKLLARSAYIDAGNSEGLTPLILAVRQRDYELTELFLSYKADLHKTSKAVRARTNKLHQYGPLGWAVDNHDVAIIGLLLDHGALINQPRSEDMTLLHNAIPYKNIDVINTLTDRGADINARSRRFPQTALGMAIDQGSLMIVKILVTHGCDVNQIFEGETPLYLAIRRREIAIARYLVENGAHIDMNALLRAIDVMNEQNLQVLLSHYKQENGVEADLEQLAVAAIRKGKEDALLLLVERGADINASSKPDRFARSGPGEGGQTLVWLAAAGGHYR
ncbi:MAG: hypothetical protein Q9174_006056, partial [Haloplaca sp. 1 TL-2023]